MISFAVDWTLMAIIAAVLAFVFIGDHLAAQWFSRQIRRQHLQEGLVMPLTFFDLSEAMTDAERRATEMLREVLTAKEWRELRFEGHLTVQSPNIPGREYRIPAHSNGVVKVYEKERIVMYLCAQPVKYLPTGDIVLMHKLHIQADEEHYLKVANRWYARPNVLAEAWRRS